MSVFGLPSTWDGSPHIHHYFYVRSAADISAFEWGEEAAEGGAAWVVIPTVTREEALRRLAASQPPSIKH